MEPLPIAISCFLFGLATGGAILWAHNHRRRRQAYHIGYIQGQRALLQKWKRQN